MLRTALAALIGATITLSAVAACTAAGSAEQPVALQTDTRERVTLTLPQVDPEPLPDIRAVAAKEAADREAAERATPALTCEPTADAKVVDNIIVNKACDDLNAEKEASHREYAEQQSVGDNDVDVDTYCDPGTGMMLDGTPCGTGSMPDGSMTSGETQYEYGCRQGYITEGC